MIIHGDGLQRTERREEWVPVSVADSHRVAYTEELTVPKATAMTFSTAHCAHFQGGGSWVLLDFGKEICGGVRLITRAAPGTVSFRVTFGESMSEACSTIGVKNATNDHSPRDFEVMVSNMSDLTFGQTGYRFVRLELLSDAEVLIRNIFAVSLLPEFEREATFTTNDQLLNDILHTAAYTLKLCMQNGYIWDGIKRDRLVWCGDLHPETLTSMYLFGETPHVVNSLLFLKSETPADGWMNNIPSYSAWWVVNLCDYCRTTGDKEFYKAHREYAVAVMKHINDCIREDGEMVFPDGYGMEYFLDWSTHQTEGAPAGVASMLRYTAEKLLSMEENADCRDILRKLEKYVDIPTDRKPIRAFQVLAGRRQADDAAMLQAGGAADLSTFMSYYILTATAKAGGTEMLSMLKEYYGGMLSRGATSFWEDFDIRWLEGSGRIDRLPAEGELDIHGDFGKFCYQQFRHSLCHAWSCGVLAFFMEYIVGICIEDGGKTVTVEPHLCGLTDLEVTVPMREGDLTVTVKNGEITVVSPVTTNLIEKF